MNQRTSIDGVIRGPGSLQTRSVPPKPHLTKPAKSHSVAPHHPKHAPERSKTLNRGAVKQPLFFGGQKNKAEQVTVPPPPSEMIARRADKARLARANKIEKSNLISRFDSMAGPKLVKKVMHLPVAKPKTHHYQQHITAAAVPLATPAKSSPLEAAIDSATSHEAKAVKIPKGKSLSKRLGLNKKGARVSLGAALAVLTISFLAYQNIPNIKMRLASSRASINGSLPSYKPSGYTLGAISPAPGQVTLDYKSNTDTKSFQVTQKKSSWNSEALLNNYVAPTNKPYQTYQEQGKTIFIYDQNNATWVDGGIWYKIEGNAQLTSDQLIRIARGL